MSWNWTDYFLDRNPFPLMPEARVQHWAGRPGVRALLSDVTQSVLATDAGISEFVIISGSFGAGKSHALRYFENRINHAEADHFQAEAVYVPKVKLAPKISFLRIYLEVMECLGEDFLKTLSNGIASRVDAAAEALATTLGSTAVAKLQKDPYWLKNQVIGKLPREDQPVIRALLQVKDGDSGAVAFLMGGSSKSLREAGFNSPVNSDYMAAKILAGVVRAMTVRIGDQTPVFNGFHLFIDEVEELLEAKANEQTEFWVNLRELLNRLPEHFCLLLAFTGDAALLEALVPQALVERTSRQNIDLQAMEVEEVKEFLAAHLSAHRPEGTPPPSSYYPFSEDAIEVVLEHTIIMVPRRIFRALRLVLDRAIRREGLAPGQEVTAELAEEILLGAGL